MKTSMGENFNRIQQAGKIPSLPFTFKKGQIITGRILELYPHQQANIQIGDTRLVAQLHASLSKGQQYWFQIESNEPLLRLKVLGDDNASKRPDKVKQLLSLLGVRMSKDRLHAVQLLLDNKTPPQKEQILQTIQLIDKVGLNQIDSEVIKEIAHRNLPVNAAIYQAVKTKDTYSLTWQLNEMHKELKSLENIEPLQNKLFQKISEILTTEKNFTSVNELRNNPSLKNILGENVFLHSQFSEKVSAKPKTTIISDLKALLRDQLPLNENLKKQFVQFSDLLVKINDTKGTNEENIRLNHLYSHLKKNGVFSKIMAATGHSLDFAKQGDKPFKFNSDPLVDEETINFMQKLASRQLDRHSEIFLISTLQKTDLNRDSKLSFLSQLKNQSMDLGLNYEYELLSNHKEKELLEQSLKSLLLQNNATSKMPVLAEKIDMLLHTITGLQLTSVLNNDDFLQFNVQIPGSSFDLQHDIHLNFESKKDKNGDVDSSYCRILFYLNLKKLKETVVDMNIIDRKINLTVYNAKELEKTGRLYKSTLKESLQRLDYKLVSLQFKLLNSEVIKEAGPVKNKTFHYSKGVDFRI